MIVLVHVYIDEMSIFNLLGVEMLKVVKVVYFIRWLACEFPLWDQ